MLKSLLLGSVAVLRGPDDEGAAGAGGANDDSDQGAGNSTVVQDDAAAAAGAASNADDAVATDDAAAVADAGPKPDWRDKEIKRKHAQIQAEKRRALELEAKLADAQALLERTQAGGADDGQQARQPVQRQQPALNNETAVMEAAHRIAAKNDYDRTCNEVAKAGKKAYGKDWDSALETLETLGGFDQTTMSGIINTDKPEQVLFLLSKDPEEYQRIMEITSLARRQTEFTKLSIKPVPKAARVSGAPAPVEMLGGRSARTGSVDLYDDKVGDDDWFKVREEQKRKRFEARGGSRV